MFITIEQLEVQTESGQEERHAPCPHCGSKWRYHDPEACKRLLEKWG